MLMNKTKGSKDHNHATFFQSCAFYTSNRFLRRRSGRRATDIRATAGVLPPLADTTRLLAQNKRTRAKADVVVPHDVS